jgi:Diacylglycerol kinase catalytic domain
MSDITRDCIRDVFVVLNPVAGRGWPQEVRRALARHLSDRRICYAVYETTGKENLVEVVRAALVSGADVVAAAGGDGTVATVATALVGTDIPLGIIPPTAGAGGWRDYRADAGTGRRCAQSRACNCAAVSLERSFARGQGRRRTGQRSAGGVTFRNARSRKWTLILQRLGGGQNPREPCGPALSSHPMRNSALEREASSDALLWARASARSA